MLSRLEERLIIIAHNVRPYATSGTQRRHCPLPSIHGGTAVVEKGVHPTFPTGTGTGNVIVDVGYAIGQRVIADSADVGRWTVAHSSESGGQRASECGACRRQREEQTRQTRSDQAT